MNEPINLREWKRPSGVEQQGRLFTCGRPGRATYGRAKIAVPEEIIDLWVNGLPLSDVLYIVSLLGRKTNGFSEFSYYPFRSALETGTKPTFENWLNDRYRQRFFVHEFPTIDARAIPLDVLQAAERQVLKCLQGHHTTVVLDSAGAERTARVCQAIGYKT